MPYSDIQRNVARTPWTLYAGDFSNVDATPGSDVNFKCTQTCELKRIQASAVSITASSQFIVELVRNSAGTPVVLVTLTSATPYVAGVILDSGELSIPLFKDEPLALRVRLGGSVG